MKNIPRISIEDPKELYEEYILQNKPIIISNFQDNWANSSVFTKVNLDEKVKQFFFFYLFFFSSLFFFLDYFPRNILLNSLLLIFLLFSTNLCVWINLLFILSRTVWLWDCTCVSIRDRPIWWTWKRQPLGTGF